MQRSLLKIALHSALPSEIRGLKYIKSAAKQNGQPPAWIKGYG